MASDDSGPGPRPLALVRAAFGALLLCFPDFMLREVPHRKIDHPADVVARILGLRHLIEAAVLGRRRSRTWVLLAVAVDVIHAATAFGLAAVDDRHRRVALSNGVSAILLAIWGAFELRDG
ncbi:MAG: hypothetical protein ACR2K6_04110 [Solirubrobacterales bacterium]